MIQIRPFLVGPIRYFEVFLTLQFQLENSNIAMNWVKLGDHDIGHD